MIAGNSTLENEMGIAAGFPQIDLKRGEIIVLKDILDVINAKEGDEVELNFEIFQAASTDLAKLKLILFDFPRFKRDYRSGLTSPGKALLDQLKLPMDSYFEPQMFVNERILDQLDERVD